MAKKVFDRDLKPGSKGLAVNVLGLLLKLQGYEGDTEIELDGDFKPGGAIEEAFKRFQREARLEETGAFDAAAREALSSELGVDIGLLTEEMFASPTVWA